jgi:hypothetical protein
LESKVLETKAKEVIKKDNEGGRRGHTGNLQHKRPTKNTKAQKPFGLTSPTKQRVFGSAMDLAVCGQSDFFLVLYWFVRVS